MWDSRPEGSRHCRPEERARGGQRWYTTKGPSDLYVHCSLHLPPHHPSLKTGFKALKSPFRRSQQPRQQVHTMGSRRSVRWWANTRRLAASLGSAWSSQRQCEARQKRGVYIGHRFRRVVINSDSVGYYVGVYVSVYVDFFCFSRCRESCPRCFLNERGVKKHRRGLKCRAARVSTVRSNQHTLLSGYYFGVCQLELRDY